MLLSFAFESSLSIRRCPNFQEAYATHIAFQLPLCSYSVDPFTSPLKVLIPRSMATKDHEPIDLFIGGHHCVTCRRRPFIMYRVCTHPWSLDFPVIFRSRSKTASVRCWARGPPCMLLHGVLSFRGQINDLTPSWKEETMLCVKA